MNHQKTRFAAAEGVCNFYTHTSTMQGSFSIYVYSLYELIRVHKHAGHSFNGTYTYVIKSDLNLGEMLRLVGNLARQCS